MGVKCFSFWNQEPQSLCKWQKACQIRRNCICTFIKCSFMKGSNSRDSNLLKKIKYSKWLFKYIQKLRKLLNKTYKRKTNTTKMEMKTNLPLLKMIQTQMTRMRMTKWMKKMKQTLIRMMRIKIKAARGNLLMVKMERVLMGIKLFLMMILIELIVIFLIVHRSIAIGLVTDLHFLESNN